MADILGLTSFLSAPPAQLATGCLLFGSVWKFFERVETVLNETTKSEVARWLKGTSIGGRAGFWPEDVQKIFDRVWAARHWSLRCFVRSAGVSYIATFAGFYIGLTLKTNQPARNAFVAGRNEVGLFLLILGSMLTVLIISLPSIAVGYLSLLKTRYALRIITRRQSIIVTVAVTIIDLFLTLCIAWAVLTALGIYVSSGSDAETAIAAVFRMRDSFLDEALQDGFLSYCIAFFTTATHPLMLAMTLPIFVNSVWLWLVVVTRFLVRPLRTLDIGFVWFRRYFDIDHRPFQSMGVIAGALAAVIYWTAALFLRLA